MTKINLLILFLFLSNFCFTQKFDYVVHNNVYVSYFSDSLKIPVVVTYKLYKVDGFCNRKNMKFINDIINLKTATKQDYYMSGFDEGHLCPAADQGGNCLNEEKTFRYYNCVPQTPDLNRKIWLSYEVLERHLSQSDSILVLNIIIPSNKYIGKKIDVPLKCVKCIFSLSSYNCLICVICSNDVVSSSIRVSLDDLFNLYNLNLNNFLPFKILKK